jgi:allantoate deiminase
MVSVETLARRTSGLVATVGKIEAHPGAANVIAGVVHATLDVRHPRDEVRNEAVAELLTRAQSAATARGVRLQHETVFELSTMQMNSGLVRFLETAVTRAGHTPHRMSSGAGHDAMILAPHVPSAMLFLQSPGGLSHHPDESVLAADVEAALDTILEFLRLLSHDEVFTHA